MDSSKFRSRLFTRSILRLPVFVTTARSVRYGDRKSTRLNSSHGYISYAVFCLKKKKRDHPHRDPRAIHAEDTGHGAPGTHHQPPFRAACAIVHHTAAQLQPTPAVLESDHTRHH